MPVRVSPHRSVLALLLPVVALQLVAVGTLVLGRDTLYLRDVLTAHLPMKQAEALALRQGSLPELDLYRGGGQPLLGNPNGAPLYPDSVLYAVAPALWAMNAHFWIHFLVAPWSFAWLARRLGSGPAAAAAGGVVYGLSGFFLSQMNLYNLVAGTALAPAFVAACLVVRDGRVAGEVRRGAAAAGALWALLLLAGEPLIAAMALGLAALAVVATRAGGATSPAVAAAPVALAAENGSGQQEAPPPIRRSPSRWLPLLLALACGTLLAAPQLVELARAIPASTRGARGYSVATRTICSWNLWQAIEQLLPLAFGRIDRSGPGGFWGHTFHTGALPLFLSLYPGVLPFALATAAGSARRRGGLFAWVAIGLGVFVSLGRFNPLLAPFIALPAARMLRFPVKAWLLVAIGLSTLAAAGWDRAVSEGDPRAARRLRVALLALGAILLVGAVVTALAAAPLQAWILEQRPRTAPPTLVAGEARRWALTAGGLAALAVLLAALLWRRSRPLAGAAALALHAAAQLVLLGPATLGRDRVEPYLRPPAFASLLPAETRVAHGGFNRLFGPTRRRRPLGGASHWLARQGAAAGLPLTGVPLRWRYELANSPEGLDTLLTRLAIEAMRPLDDGRRLRMLRVWGIDTLLIERPLPPDSREVRLLATAHGPLAPVYVYRVEGAAPAARRVAGVQRAGTPRQALAILLDPTFDPRREVVLQGEGPPIPGAAGVATVEREAAEELVVAVSGDRPGWLVVQRAWQPHWLAAVDGRPAPVVAADIHRLAVAVPAGRQRVHLWIDRRPLRKSAWAAAVGLVGLLALALPKLHRRARALERDPGGLLP